MKRGLRIICSTFCWCLFRLNAEGLRTECGPVAPPVPFPAYLGSFNDPVYRTRVTRITGDKNTPVPNVGGVWAGRNRSIYSLKQVWSADEKLLYLHFGGPLILDGETYEVLHRWGPPVAGTWHPTVADVMVLVRGNRVEQWNGRTGETTEICRFPGYTDLVQLASEDFLSADGCFTAVTARRESDGADVGFGVDLHRRTRASPDLRFTEFGFARKEREHQILKPSPSGRYLVMSARGAGGEGNSRGEALAVFDFQGHLLTEQRKFPHTPGHGDLALTADGRDVKVGRSDDDAAGPKLSGKEVLLGLSDGQLLPLALSGGDHTSGRAFRRPGWAFVSDRSARDGQQKDSFIAAVALDGSRIEYICHTRHEDPVDYWAQAQGIPSPSGTRVLFASNWGTGPKLDDDDAHSFVADFRHLLPK